MAQKNNINYFFDTKTVQPNVGSYSKFVEQILNWYAFFYAKNPTGKAVARIVFPRKFENFALDLSLASVNSMRILHYNPTFFRFLPTNDAPAFFNIFLISPEITPSCS